MRVMPPKGGPSSAMRFPAHGFFVYDPRITLMNANKKKETSSGGTTSVSSHSPVGEAASFPSNNNRDANSVPYSFPNSKKIFVAGKLHPDLRVPFREISLAL